jgi:hypothetical protein
MPETKAQRSEAARKGAARHKRRQQREAAVDRGTELSEEILKSLESGQRAAIDAVRRFVDVVDERLPDFGDGRSGRQEVIDAAMQMADRLVHAQYEFLHDVVGNAGKALSGEENGKTRTTKAKKTTKSASKTANLTKS